MLPIAILCLLPLLPSTLAFRGGHNAPRRAHHHADVEARDNRLRAIQELEERLMPITATTTLYVEETLTQTVWVQATGQAVFEPGTTLSKEEVSSTSESAPSNQASLSSLHASASRSSAAISSASAVTPSASSPSSASQASASGSAKSSVPMTSDHASVTDDAASLSASASLTASVSASSGSSAPRWTHSSGSGPSRPRPTSFSSSAESSYAAENASSSVWSTETLWSGASSSASIWSSESSSSYPSASASASWSDDHPSSSASYSAETLWAESSSYSPSATVSSAWSASSATSSSPWSASSAISASASASAASASAASPSAGIANLSPIPEKVMLGYYPDWSGWYLKPEDVDWSLFDVIDFAFALPTASGGLQFTQWDSSDLLKRLVAGGHAAGKRVKLSIGGWTGSAYFSTLTADANLRATFVANILQSYHSYNLDGIDIDWEYPGTSGAAGNAVSPNDSANYLLFLQDLRAALPANAIITTATQVWPWAGANGQPLSDVSAFAKVIDWILIMNYDIWGSSSTPGPNAPLSNACGNSTQPLANAYAAVSSWTTAGMPAQQITLGVPAYGYLQSSWATSLRQRRSMFPSPPHKQNATHSVDSRGTVTVYNGNGGSTDGQVMFEALISQGALVSDGNGGFVGAGGFVRHWDSCSSTPWLKSDDVGQIVTYDDPESMSLKGQFAAQAGIRGCNVFSIDGDWTGYSWPLTTAVRSGLGL